MRVFLRKSQPEERQLAGQALTSIQFAEIAGQVWKSADPVLRQGALVQHETAARVLGRFRIVRDHHHRLAVLPVEHLQQGQDLGRRPAIEVARRLVTDEERRVGHDGPGDRDTLLLAPRELPRLVARAIGQPDERQGDGRPPPALRGGQAGQEERQLHVALGGEHRHQVVELEDEPHVGRPPSRQLATRELIDPLAADDDLAAGRRVQPADEVEQGGLAGPRRTHEGEELALRDVEVDAVQDLDPLASAPVRLRDAPDLDQAHGEPTAGPDRTSRA